MWAEGNMWVHTVMKLYPATLHILAKQTTLPCCYSVLQHNKQSVDNTEAWVAPLMKALTQPCFRLGTHTKNSRWGVARKLIRALFGILKHPAEQTQISSALLCRQVWEVHSSHICEESLPRQLEAISLELIVLNHIWKLYPFRVIYFNEVSIYNRESEHWGGFFSRLGIWTTLGRILKHHQA